MMINQFKSLTIVFYQELNISILAPYKSHNKSSWQKLNPDSESHVPGLKNELKVWAKIELLSGPERVKSFILPYVQEGLTHFM